MTNAMKSKCLVLGGCGFLGSHVAEELVGLGHDVVIFDKTNVSENNIAGFRDRVRIVTGDFTNEFDVAAALDEVEMVFHFIGTTLPQNSMTNPEYDVESNLVASVRLLDACVARGVRRVVFSSSGGTVYGIPRQLPIFEGHPTDPICSYGITKLAVEKYLALYERLHGLDYRILRFANPYGPRQSPKAAQGAIGVFLGRVRGGEEITIWGDGAVRRDYIFVKDAVRAAIAVAFGDVAPGAYNVGTGVSTSLSELLAIIERVTGTTPKITYAEARGVDVPENALDIARISAATDWRPQVTLENGIALTWAGQ